MPIPSRPQLVRKKDSGFLLFEVFRNFPLEGVLGTFCMREGPFSLFSLPVKPFMNHVQIFCIAQSVILQNLDRGGIRYRASKSSDEECNSTHTHETNLVTQKPTPCCPCPRNGPTILDPHPPVLCITSTMMMMTRRVVRPSHCHLRGVR